MNARKRVRPGRQGFARDGYQKQSIPPALALKNEKKVVVGDGKLSNCPDNFIEELQRIDMLFVLCELDSEKPKQEPVINYWI